MKTTIGIAGIILLFFLSFHSCKEELEDSKQSLPLVTTSDVSGVEYSKAIVGGIAANDGGTPIISRGVCWNTTGNPTISDCKTFDGPGTGNFESTLTGLVPSTKYYVRTYATNSIGTVYGNEVTFTTNVALLPSFSNTIVSSFSCSLTVVYSEITSDNGNPISARGVCWNVTGTPTISDNKTIDGSGAGAFTSNINDLIPDVTYFVRTYATNNAGTAYGNEIKILISLPGDINFNSNLSYGTLSDIDDNTYKTIRIGSQVWMAENLKTTRFNDGKAITLVADQTAWDNLNSPGYCWYSNDEATFKNAYGALYNWFTVNTGKLCPVGWHVPSLDEWKILQSFLGGENVAGDKLKETGTAHWQSPNAEANNESGFTAIPAGIRYSEADGGFQQSKVTSYMFSSTYLPVDNYLNTIISFDSPYFDLSWEDIHIGCSVRCLKD